MDIENLSHNDFIKDLAQTCGDNRAWSEFINRYQKIICGTIAKRVAGTKYYQEIQSIANDVYLILLNNNCRALKNFKGQYENAIFKYLSMIASHAAIRYMKGKTVETFTDDMGEVLRGLGITTDDPWEFIELKEEVEDCLEKIAKSSRHPERDKLIFRVRFYDDLTPEDIADFIKKSHKELATKRIWGILGDMRKDMQKCLEEKFKK